MLVYRIVKQERRARDLSGTGAFLVGGRWNSEGTYALYTSENPSLALLELLVHADEADLPPDMYVLTLEISDAAPVHTITAADLPKDWRVVGNQELKETGDKLFKEKQVFMISAPSAVFPGQRNYILNPLYPSYSRLVKIKKVEQLAVDQRLRNSSTAGA